VQANAKNLFVPVRFLHGTGANKLVEYFIFKGFESSGVLLVAALFSAKSKTS